MTLQRVARIGLAFGLVATLSACSGGFGSANIFGGKRSSDVPVPSTDQRAAASTDEFQVMAGRKRERGDAPTPIQSLFFTNANPNTTVEVNKYLWQAAQDVLDFLPIQSVDPFSGIIVTGFGTPPGGGGSYRATIYVQDPALDARSLKVALVGRGGPVSADVQRAVEDAILTRARQLRIRDTKL